MKLRVHMKTPDAVEYAINGAIEDCNVNRVCDGEDRLTEDEIYDLREELEEVCKNWFSYGECVTIEIDTESKTASVSKPGY